MRELEQMEDKVLCTVCSHWSYKNQWLNDKCSFCGQVLILAGESETCQICNHVNRKNMDDGRCPKCQ